MTASPNQGPEALASREAIKETMRGLLDAGAQPLDMESLEVPGARGDTIQYGHYKFQLEADGQQMTDVRTFIVVHGTRDGDTTIVLDCFNSNQPPTGEEEAWRGAHVAPSPSSAR